LQNRAAILSPEDVLMNKKPTYEELELKVKELEKESAQRKRADAEMSKFKLEI